MRLTRLVVGLVSGLVYYVVLLLGLAALLWVKLQIESLGATGDLRGWFLFELSWLPFGVLPWVGMHIATVLVLWSRRPIFRSALYYPAVASILGALLCAAVFAILGVVIDAAPGRAPGFWTTLVVWVGGAGAITSYAGALLSEKTRPSIPPDPGASEEA